MAQNQLILAAGDVAPVPQAVLADTAGDPLDLSTLVSLRFRMTDFYSGGVAVDAPASVLQLDDDRATWGQVAFFWAPRDTARPGLYRAAFITDFGNGVQHFPADDSYFVLINPAR